MNQGSLFQETAHGWQAAKPAAPFVRGSDTSETAARSIEHLLEPMEAVVLEILGAHPDGLSDFELQAQVDALPDPKDRFKSARNRRIYLVEKRLAEQVPGQKRLSPSGRPCAVWRLTAAGIRETNN